MLKGIKYLFLSQAKSYTLWKALEYEITASFLTFQKGEFSLLLFFVFLSYIDVLF